MLQSAFLQLATVRIYVCDLLETRVTGRSYNQHVRLLSPEPWLVGTTKAYSEVGTDIVMESITLIDLPSDIPEAGFLQSMTDDISLGFCTVQVSA